MNVKNTLCRLCWTDWADCHLVKSISLPFHRKIAFWGWRMNPNLCIDWIEHGRARTTDDARRTKLTICSSNLARLLYHHHHYGFPSERLTTIDGGICRVSRKIDRKKSGGESIAQCERACNMHQLPTCHRQHNQTKFIVIQKRNRKRKRRENSYSFSILSNSAFTSKCTMVNRINEWQKWNHL